MSQRSRIEGLGGDKVIREVAVHQNEDKPAGIVVFASDLQRFEAKQLPFFNTSGSIQMAVNASGGGSPKLVHNGEDSSLWATTALVGTWDFASTDQAQAGSQSVDATATSNNDEALFASPTTIDMNDRVSYTGYIYLTRFNAAQNGVGLRLRFSGSNVGSEVLLQNYITVGNLNVWQKFTIPKEHFILTNNLINEAVVRTVRNGAQAPNYYLDTMQLEQATSTGIATFTAQPETGTTYFVSRINFLMTFNTSGSVSAANSQIPNLSPNKFGNLAKLTSGLTVQVQSRSRISFSAVIKNHEDLMFDSFRIANIIADDETTIVDWLFESPEPIFMDANCKDKAEITISDDLSGLISFKAVIHGKVFMSSDFNAS